MDDKMYQKMKSMTPKDLKKMSKLDLEKMLDGVGNLVCEDLECKHLDCEVMRFIDSRIRDLKMPEDKEFVRLVRKDFLQDEGFPIMVKYKKYMQALTINDAVREYFTHAAASFILDDIRQEIADSKN